MSKNAENLIWLDLEMTGLDPLRDRILEIATVVTDKNLNVLAEGPELPIHQVEDILRSMDDWNRRHHGESGLIGRVCESSLGEADAEQLTLDFLGQWVPAGVSPLCGNSICQDRRFMASNMPRLERYFHYRNLDVSTIKELVSRWAPELKDAFKKTNRHMALDDIHESIAELRFYRTAVMKI